MNKDRTYLQHTCQFKRHYNLTAWAARQNVRTVRDFTFLLTMLF